MTELARTCSPASTNWPPRRHCGTLRQAGRAGRGVLASTSAGPRRRVASVFRSMTADGAAGRSPHQRGLVDGDQLAGAVHRSSPSLGAAPASPGPPGVETRTDTHRTHHPAGHDMLVLGPEEVRQLPRCTPPRRRRGPDDGIIVRLARGIGRQARSWSCSAPAAARRRTLQVGPDQASPGGSSLAVIVWGQAVRRRSRPDRCPSGPPSGRPLPPGGPELQKAYEPVVFRSSCYRPAQPQPDTAVNRQPGQPAPASWDRPLPPTRLRADALWT